MFNLSDTIAAVCTPKGIGSIAAIRISGAESWEITSKFFSTGKSFAHMQAVHGLIKDEEGNVIDEVVVLPFKAPNSFTAEDVVEIFCHGSVQIPSMILDLCLKHGARLANGGEFTFRAFVNGRIDLTEAEAINEVIKADTSKAVYSSTKVLSGSLKEKIGAFKEHLHHLLATIESSIEFPLDVDPADRGKTMKLLNEIDSEIKSLIKASKEGQILRNGFRVSIVGSPNVGKSSLLNRLLENERAIVTDTPGTTRDVLEEKIIIDGYPIVIVDTAGIRELKEKNSVEKIGIKRSKETIDSSDLLLFVYDLSDEKTVDENLLELVKEKNKMLVGNKADLDLADSSTTPDLKISAMSGLNIDLLKKEIINKLKQFTGKNNTSENIYVNERQKELLIQCSSSISYASKITDEGVPEDFIADELKKAISKLDEISGVKVNEEMVENIFSKFCIGK